MVLSSQKSFNIKLWAKEDRPREKLLLKGKSSLTNAELLGILLSSGYQSMSAVDLAKQILAFTENDLNKLASLSISDLVKFKGIGPAKAITIVSALEIGRRRNDFTAVKPTAITCSKDIYQYMRSQLLDQPQEEFWIILLKRNNEIISKEQISKGGLSGTFVDPKVIFKVAIDLRASSLVLIHNHPSGNIQPSKADLLLTKKIKKAGLLLDIHVIDHLIFTNDGYFSFLDHSIVF